MVSLDSFTLELYTVIPPPLLLPVPVTIAQVLLEKPYNLPQICTHQLHIESALWLLYHSQNEQLQTVKILQNRLKITVESFGNVVLSKPVYS